MQLPTDLQEVSTGDNEILLKEADGDRRLLVRFLQEQTCTVRIESYQADKHPRTGEITHGQRLAASLTTVAPDFRVMLYPFRDGQPLPTTQWNRNDSMLTVSFADQVDEITFSTKEGQGTKVKLTR